MPGVISPSACAVAAGPARILRPARVLQRFRPVRARAVGEALCHRLYQSRAAWLVVTHFPEAAGEIDPQREDWWETFRYFLSLVEEADWFEIDWLLLDHLWECWVNEAEDDWMHDLAAYLTGIPVRCYGFTESDIENYDCLCTLAGLITEEVSLAPSTLVAYGLYDNLTEQAKEELRLRLEAEDFSAYGEPLCWLPEMAAIATHSTGNRILDTTTEVYDLWPDRFTWSEDLNLIKEAWQEARPVAEHYKKFIAYFEDQHTAEDLMVRMVAAILGEDYEDERED